MSDILSREQKPSDDVLKFCFCGSGHVYIHIDRYDADVTALRTRLAEQTARADAAEKIIVGHKAMELPTLERIAQDKVQLQQQVADLTAKLAEYDDSLEIARGAIYAWEKYASAVTAKLAAMEQDGYYAPNEENIAGGVAALADHMADLTAQLEAAEKRWHDAVTHDGTLDELAARGEKLAAVEQDFRACRVLHNKEANRQSSDIITLRQHLATVTQERDAIAMESSRFHDINMKVICDYNTRITELVQRLATVTQELGKGEQYGWEEQLRRACQEANIPVAESGPIAPSKVKDIVLKLATAQAELADEQFAYKQLSEQWNRCDLERTAAQDEAGRLRDALTEIRRLAKHLGSAFDYWKVASLQESQYRSFGLMHTKGILSLCKQALTPKVTK